MRSGAPFTLFFSIMACLRVRRSYACCGTTLGRPDASASAQHSTQDVCVYMGPGVDMSLSILVLMVGLPHRSCTLSHSDLFVCFFFYVLRCVSVKHDARYRGKKRPSVLEILVRGYGLCLVR